MFYRLSKAKGIHLEITLMLSGTWHHSVVKRRHTTKVAFIVQRHSRGALHVDWTTESRLSNVAEESGIRCVYARTMGL